MCVCVCVCVLLAGLRGRIAAGELSILSQPQVAVLDRLFLWSAVSLCTSAGVCLTALQSEVSTHLFACILLMHHTLTVQYHSQLCVHMVCMSLGGRGYASQRQT